MVIKKCKKWWQYISRTEKTEPSRFGSVTKSNQFGSIFQKLEKTEPNRPMLTPTCYETLPILVALQVQPCGPIGQCRDGPNHAGQAHKLVTSFVGPKCFQVLVIQTIVAQNQGL